MRPGAALLAAAKASAGSRRKSALQCLGRTPRRSRQNGARRRLSASAECAISRPSSHEEPPLRRTSGIPEISGSRPARPFGRREFRPAGSPALIRTACEPDLVSRPRPPTTGPAPIRPTRAGPLSTPPTPPTPSGAADTVRRGRRRPVWAARGPAIRGAGATRPRKGRRRHDEILFGRRPFGTHRNAQGRYDERMTRRQTPSGEECSRPVKRLAEFQSGGNPRDVQ